ncbi:MAG: TIR domain-containing protein [Parvularculaceae bacterium]
MTRRYKAFISYSWADREWGEWLHRSLETYRAPKGVADGQLLHPIFKDREEEAAGVSVGAAIEAALGASEFLIVICSPRSAQSMWVNREVAWFKTYKNKANILALIVDGEPGIAGVPGREAEECFPKTLTHKVGSDLQPTDDWEDAPLAADARALGDGKRGAKLKLAAALLGVGLDALVRRDERRRTIRRRFVTGASLALAAVLGGLSIFAFTQRDAAILARNDAVKARDDAEGIIELILTDLKSDLEGFGTLKSVTAIGNRAVGYYEGQDVKALTPDQLGRRARVLLMLGEADNKRGDLTAALARYETAAATTSEQLARDPANPQRMFDHAQSVFWVGYIAWQRGDRKAAKSQFTEYHDLAQRLVAKDPANEDWQAELDYAYSNLGTLAMDDGDAEEAEGYFRKSLEIALIRLDKAPVDVDRVSAAGQAYAWLSKSLYSLGRVEEVSTLRALEFKLYGGVIESGASDATLRTAAFVSLYSLAQADIALQRFADAASRASIAATQLDKIRKADSHNQNIVEVSAVARTVLAEANLHLGLRDDAADELRTAIALVSAGGLDQTDLRRRIRFDAEILLAQIGVGNGSQASLNRVRELENELGAAVDSGAADPELVQRYCVTLALHARNDRDSMASWNRIVELLDPISSKQNPRGLTLLAEAHVRQGNRGSASEIADRLVQAGWVHPDFSALLERFPEIRESDGSGK